MGWWIWTSTRGCAPILREHAMALKKRHTAIKKRQGLVQDD